MLLNYSPSLQASPSGCMTINCPPHSLTILEHSSRAHGPRDCLTIRMDDRSLQNCPDLDPLSSMDSTQTIDSLVTPESPYAPSFCDSLEEGTDHTIHSNDNGQSHIAQVTQSRD